MRRVVVIGGLGHFGRTIVAELAQFGIAALTASRTADAKIRCNAEDPASLRAVLRKGDVVIDAAGPFHLRTTVLLEAAIEIGCDVIDINDNLRFAREVVAHSPRIAAAGIRVFTSASTVSAVAAAIVRYSGIVEPIRVTAFLVPATRSTANRGSALSLLRTVGQPISVWRNGRLEMATGWSDPQTFPMPAPLGHARGRLYESADAIHLPRIWPSLRNVAMYVDSNVPGANWLLSMAARSRMLRQIIASSIDLGTYVTRRFGATTGGVGYEIEAADGVTARYTLCGGEQGYLTAIAPAVLAARAFIGGTNTPPGLLPLDRFLELSTLREYLASKGIEIVTIT